MFDEIFGTFEESDWGELKDKSGGDKNKNNINKDDDALREDVGGEGVKPVADDATVLPDGGDAGDPDNHEDAGNVDWDGDAVVIRTENFDGEINEECGDKISGRAEALEDGFVDFI